MSDAAAVTELRVHGVSGTPPEHVLDRPLLRKVAGDHEAGFYRPREEYGGVTGPGGARLEAYSWGNLTAGAAARAFWLLLLPFTLANVASWMRPVRVGSGSRAAVRRADAFLVGLSRLFALSLTATLVVAATGVALDLVGWQCAAPGNACGQSRSYLRVLTAGLFSPPGRRLAATVIVPLAVIGVLWYLARRTWIHYEKYRAGVAGDGEALADPGFWYGRHLVGRLRAIHISAALVIVAALLTYPVLAYDRGSAGPRWYSIAGIAVFAVALGILVLAAGLLWLPAVGRRDDPAPRIRQLLKVVRGTAVVTVLAAVAYAWLSRPSWASTGSLPGYSATVTALFTAQVLVLILIALALLPLRRAVPPDDQPRPAFAGFATPIFSALALFTASAFSAGVSYRVADWLNGRRVPSPSDIFHGQQLALQPPRAYEWASFGFTFAVLLVVALVVAVRLLLMPRLAKKARPVTDADFQGARAESAGRAERIDRAIGEANLTDQVARLVGWVLVPALIFACAIDLVVLMMDIGPVDLAPSGSSAAVLLSFLTNAGTWLINASAFGLVILGVQAYRTPRLRKLVGIVWDLGTFWPRAAHPLAPPCYAERVVPELVTRSTWLAGPDQDGDRGGVILSGHSQGSVLVAATMMQLPPEVRARSALLTYGSPLCRLYARFFPAYFGRATLNALAADLAGRTSAEAVHADGVAPSADPAATRPAAGPAATRWINLWRATDPIGGAVGVPGPVDRRCVDPLCFETPPGDTVPPRALGHSGYPVDNAFGVAVAGLAAQLPAEVGRPHAEPGNDGRPEDASQPGAGGEPAAGDQPDAGGEPGAGDQSGADVQGRVRSSVT